MFFHCIIFHEQFNLVYKIGLLVPRIEGKLKDRRMAKMSRSSERRIQLAMLVSKDDFSLTQNGVR